MKELHLINPDLISEIALRTNDSYFKELPRMFYEQALYRANRIVAKKYSIMQSVYSFEETPPAEENLTEDIALTLSSFRGEYLVVVNGVEFKKVSDNEIELNSQTYHLYDTEEGLKFNYSPRKYGEANSIQIYYTIQPDLNEYADGVDPVIPSRYQEEQIEYSIQDICRMAIPRTTGQAKEKYVELLKLYSKNESEIDSRLTPNTSWTEIKLWQFP